MPQAPRGELRLPPRLLPCCFKGAACGPAAKPLRAQTFICTHLWVLLPACPAEQGVQDTVLEQELPNLSVNDRALAINSLLSALKLQACRELGLLLGCLCGGGPGGNGLEEAVA